MQFPLIVINTFFLIAVLTLVYMPMVMLIMVWFNTEKVHSDLNHRTIHDYLHFTKTMTTSLLIVVLHALKKTCERNPSPVEKTIKQYKENLKETGLCMR